MDEKTTINNIFGKIAEAVAGGGAVGEFIFWLSAIFVGLSLLILLVGIRRKWFIARNSKILHATGMVAKKRYCIIFLLLAFATFFCNDVNLLGCNSAIATFCNAKSVFWSVNSSFTITIIISVLCLGVVPYFAHKIKKTIKFDKNYQKDALNHRTQSAVLISVLIYVVALIMLIHSAFGGANIFWFGLFGTLLGWIFQDAIKGVVAYYYFRINGLLHIGDWIEVQSQHIDGIITDFSLLTVTVENWDNTQSTVPIAALQTGSFKNNQEMLSGNKSGRRMYRSFIIDTRSIRTISKGEIDGLIDKLAKRGEDTFALKQIDFSNEEVEVLNIYAFRTYLYHWLMINDEVTRSPRLLVRLMEPIPEGIPLQIYVYILATTVAPYEQVQSRIMEHTLLAMQWFGLRMYQKPSGDDISKMMSVLNKE